MTRRNIPQEEGGCGTECAFIRERQEKFLYVCDTLDMWEWDVRVLDIQDGVEGDHAPVCVGGRGAAPPEFCGGPTGYRLMLKRQREGAAMSDLVRLEVAVQMLADACPGQSADLLALSATGSPRAETNRSRPGYPQLGAE
jgi:hypothetical protein